MVSKTLGLILRSEDSGLSEGSQLRLIDPSTPPPAHYFPGDDPSRPPRNRWRSHAHLLIGNWLNEVYQTTPFQLETIGA